MTKGWPYLLSVACVISALLLRPQVCRADDPPQSSRTQGYDGYGTSVRGDIRTVGMAGATVGLADTVIAAHDNPGGLAMTLGQGDLSGSSDNIRDAYLLPWITRVKTNSFGLGLAPYPWGFSFEYVSDYSESILVNNSTQLNVSTAEYRFTGARVFCDNHLSLGASVNFGRGEESMISSENSGDPNLNGSSHAMAIGLGLGVQYRLPLRVLLGLSYQKGMDYGFTPQGFYQPIHVPYRVAAGIGWIPNRNFRTDVTFYGIGATNNTSLLLDPDTRNGQAFTLQPRAGLGYLFADYQEFQSTLFMGAYYETSEIQNAPNRFHVTAGVELKPWVLNFGWGIDRAIQYTNYIFTAGIDPFKVMERLGLIPKTWHPSEGRLFPSVEHLSEEGLARPLMDNWVPPAGPDIDPISLGMDLPKRIGERALDAQQQLQNLGKQLMEQLSDEPAAPPEETPHPLNK